MSKKTEILAPAGSFEALRAAVANGADAVYIGYGDFNARRLAKNFTYAELCEACEFCHKRGVLVYVTVNTLASDREMEDVEKLVREINRAGVDAAIVADLGIARLIREVCPTLPIHASTQMTVHNIEGVRALSELGFSRVVLARELSRDEIKKICKESPVEIEVFVHGALCMCYSGQCEMSAVIGRRSGNRGLCAQPCRMEYKMSENGAATYALSLSDLCLADYICEMADMGVASLKIEGRMKRPEYVAIVSRIYSDVLRERRAPTEKEKRDLRRIFSREGFTDGYYTKNPGKKMFGVRTETEAPQTLLDEAKKTYEDVPIKQEKVSFFCIIEEGKPALLAAIDEHGNRAMAQGKIPEAARNVALNEESVTVQLKKTGGTRFVTDGINIKIGENLSLPLSELNSMRRECLDALEENYSKKQERREEGSFNVGFKLLNRKEKPDITVSVKSVSQISNALLSRGISSIFIPLTEFEKEAKRIKEISEKVPVAALFPRIIKDTEEDLIRKFCETARDIGIKVAAVGNIGHISLAKEYFSDIRADYGTNITNSYALREMKKQGISKALLSPELTLPKVRDLSKIIDTELVVYGRLPLMICENCVISAQVGACVCGNRNFLYDRTGAAFPIVREFLHRTEILNSQKLFLADKARDYERIGLASVRLMFTTENVRECEMVLDAYLGKSDYKPSQYTRGLYYRGVE